MTLLLPKKMFRCECCGFELPLSYAKGLAVDTQSSWWCFACESLDKREREIMRSPNRVKGEG